MAVTRRVVTQALILAATSILMGCASHSTIVNRPVGTHDLPRLLADSPHVTPLSKNSYSQRTSPAAIEFFNYTFHLLNQPDLIKNWQYHYVVGPASQPNWRYERIKEVLVYLPSRTDEAAIEQFRKVASSSGGDAVVDLHRKPIITKRLPAPIDAYMYYGVVVRRTE